MPWVCCAGGRSITSSRKAHGGRVNLQRIRRVFSSIDIVERKGGPMLDVFFDKWWRVGGMAGILFLITFIVAIMLEGEPPSFDDPVNKIRDWFADNGKQFLVAEYLIGLAFTLFFLPFLASLRGVLASA